MSAPAINPRLSHPRIPVGPIQGPIGRQNNICGEVGKR